MEVRKHLTRGHVQNAAPLGVLDEALRKQGGGLTMTTGEILHHKLSAHLPCSNVKGALVK